MGLFNLFGGSGGLFAAKKPTAESKPDVTPRQKSIPGVFRTASPAKSKIPSVDRRTANTDLKNFRRGVTTQQVTRDLAMVTPELSGTVGAYLRTALTEKYTAVARNQDGTFNTEATIALHQLLARFDTLQDYSDGFSGISSLRSLSESLAKEMMLYGAMSLELVLDDSYLPRQLVPVTVPSISWYPDEASGSKWLRPVQTVGGEEISLDYPTFFYVAADQLLNEVNPSSPLEAALQPALFSQELIDDIRNVVQRALHPRMDVTIDIEKLKSFLPVEVLNDDSETTNAVNALLAELESRVNGLKPEEALVHYDLIGIKLLNNDRSNLSNDYTALKGMAEAKLAAGAKVMPSILGLGSANQSIASAETMVFMKNADGLIRQKLNEIYSRALTLAVRLLGFDAVVRFEYDTIDLRPDSELEAFKAARQDRILSLLSLGLMTDEEASIILTGKLPPEGAPKLSGTRFKDSSAAVGNLYSGDPAGGGQSGGGALNQSVKPPTSPNKRGG